MKYFLIIITASLFFTSCFEDPIDLDLNEDNTKLVIEAWISDLPTPQFVAISYTVNYLGSDPYVHEANAEVTLRSESGDIYTLEYQDEGRYYLPTDWRARLGEEYELTCTVDGQIYQATHVMRPSPEIEDLYIDMVYNDEDSLTGYETVFAFQEPQGLGDAFYVIDFLKGSSGGEELFNGGYADDEFFEGQYINDIRVTDTEYPYQIGDTVMVGLYSIGQETANFLQDAESEVFRGGPFDPPPANVRTNLSGGAIGYFIMSGADLKEIVIE